MVNDSIGIDISKDSLDAFRLHDGAHRSFANNKAGFGKLVRWQAQFAVGRVVYEPTGVYHRDFEQACAGRLPLVRVNPLQLRRFAQARGARAKTDRVDARMLAMMGTALALAPDPPVSKEQHELKELQAYRRALVKDRTRLRNQIRNVRQPLIKRQIEARLSQIERQRTRIDAEIDARLKESRGPDRDRLLSIPGIGPVAAAAILILCPEIGTIGRKQLAALAGLAPIKRQSGRKGARRAP